MRERTIDSAIVIRGGQRRIEDMNLFLHGKKGFAIRNLFNEDLIDFECQECGQKLVTCYKKAVFLKHKPNSEPCILKDSSTEQKLIDEINRINLSKESPRHQELKAILVEKLTHTEGVTKIESEEIIIRENDRRKPDVFCIYNGMPIAFEVQLSSISQRYILYRSNFYKEAGIYLFWILDNFSKYDQNHRDRDIKYLNTNQNIFEINDLFAPSSTFICHFKEPFIYDEVEVRTKWLTAEVDLADLYFDEFEYQIYYFDYLEKKSTLDRICAHRRHKRAEKEEQQRLLEQQRQRKIKKVQNELDEERAVLSKIKSDLENINWKLRSLEEEQINLSGFIENPKEGLQKWTQKMSMFYLTSNFFSQQYENKKSQFELRTQQKNEIEKERRKIQQFKTSIEDIGYLKTIDFHGIGYKVLNPKKHASVIKKNKTRLNFAYTSTLDSGQPRFIRPDRTNTVEKLLAQKNRYAILVNFRSEVDGYQKEILKSEKRIAELESSNEQITRVLEKECSDWCVVEIERLEKEKMALKDRHYHLVLQEIDTDVKISKIEEKLSSLN